jgi:hypothetical protein
MARENKNRSSVRAMKSTVAELKKIGEEIGVAVMDHHAPRWWAGDEVPTTDEVIQHLIRFYRKYQARRKKAGKTRSERQKALRAAGLDTGGNGRKRGKA